ncbi:cytochrome c [Azospirillum sp. INR13]|uniref:cytochrome c n=1 Tax=Azospirillum sp. INR13 TaxID=2596919 RepID=UPI0018920786
MTDSAAKPELWKNWAEAQRYWSGLQPVAERLDAAVKSGDRTQIAQALGATSKACGSCHEDFRVKKN